MIESKNFLLVSILPHTLTDEEALKDLRELKSLVETYGGEVLDLVTQRREVHDKGMYIGSGKIQEVAQVIRSKKIDVVVLNAIVKAGQIHDIKTILQKTKASIEVWDKVDLILHIFSKHANTAEAKLQIELASMRHMGPRIYGMGMEMSRQAGGIGGRGIGETNTELMIRHWRREMKKVQEKLDKLSDERARQLDRRKKVGLQTVSIIGYTNAGKTSLFNLLTHKKNLVENALFATLDSSAGKIYLPEIQKEVLVTDTIGFIKNLPARLIDAFKSTLMESIHSDLLLHVIDVSDEDMYKKIRVVEKILYDLGIFHKKKIYVFNKIDNLESFDKEAVIEKYGEYSPTFISVRNERGITDLIKAISYQLSTAGAGIVDIKDEHSTIMAKDE